MSYHQQWSSDGIQIQYHVLDNKSQEVYQTQRLDNKVRLHIVLEGQYYCQDKGLRQQVWHRAGWHQLQYSHEMDMQVSQLSNTVCTFGIAFDPERFLSLATQGNTSMQQLAQQVQAQQNQLVPNSTHQLSFEMQQCIQAILNHPFQGSLANLFLSTKSIELLILQAQLAEAAPKQHNKTLSKSQQDKLWAAKELLHQQLQQPPKLAALAKMVQLNEYQLKKGFKQLFGCTVFNYVHQCRMQQAKRLLLDTNKTAQEIAYEMGYSSPQHFSKAFKKTFQTTPNSIRTTPDCTI